MIGRTLAAVRPVPSRASTTVGTEKRRIEIDSARQLRLAWKAWNRGG
jgi:hypothetical protein